jgi:hypothetical protein
VLIAHHHLDACVVSLNRMRACVGPVHRGAQRLGTPG